MNPRLAEIFSSRPETRHPTAAPFRVGQVWQVLRGDQIGAQLLIVKIDRDPGLDPVVHVTVKGPLYTSGGSTLEAIPHLPFTAEALRASDLHLVGKVDPVPEDWRSMHEDWLDDVASGEAGLFILPADEVLSHIMERLPL